MFKLTHHRGLALDLWVSIATNHGSVSVAPARRHFPARPPARGLPMAEMVAATGATSRRSQRHRPALKGGTGGACNRDARGRSRTVPPSGFGHHNPPDEWPVFGSVLQRRTDRHPPRANAHLTLVA